MFELGDPLSTRSLHDQITEIAGRYTYEQANPFANSSFGVSVRKDLALTAKRQIMYLPHELIVKASVGAGNWAAVPWLGFFDPLVTMSATQGFYVVYLIDPQNSAVHLSLNQGTTAAYREFGVQGGREVLRRRAADIALRVYDYAKHFDCSPIELTSDLDLPKGYEAGHAFGRTYLQERDSGERFIEDLERMLSAYSALVDRGGITPSDAMQAETNGSDITEVRRHHLSLRIERSSSVRNKVLKARNSICEGCGLDPIVHYGYVGKEVNTPLEVHHAKPLFELAEGESRRYRVPDDFLVLCPTCHTVIHQQSDQADINALRAKVQFRFESRRA